MARAGCPTSREGPSPLSTVGIDQTAEPEAAPGWEGSAVSPLPRSPRIHRGQEDHRADTQR